MSDWIRRTYDSVGLTQAPPGRYLPALQEPYLGKVLLCIDVSGSMASHDGGRRTRLQRVVAGAERFIVEAVEARYRVGLVLWHHDVDRFEPLSSDPEPVLRALRSAVSYGGNDIVPTVRLGIRELGGLSGDRVMAVFGDGDIGAVGPAVAAARKAADLGIRIIVRGLGADAAGALGNIATGGREQTVIRSAQDLESGIAAMITSVTRRKSP